MQHFHTILISLVATLSFSLSANECEKDLQPYLVEGRWVTLMAQQIELNPLNELGTSYMARARNPMTGELEFIPLGLTVGSVLEKFKYLFRLYSREKHDYVYIGQMESIEDHGLILVIKMIREKKASRVFDEDQPTVIQLDDFRQGKN